MKLLFRVLILMFEAPWLKVGVLNLNNQPLSLKDEVLRVNGEPLELDNGVK